MKSPGRIELTPAQTVELIERIKKKDLSDQDCDVLVELIAALGWMNHQLEEKRLSIQRLRRIFGIKTEKSSHILETIEKELEDKSRDQSKNGSGCDTVSKEASSQRKGHGRLGADQYPAADIVPYSHKTLKAAMTCPGCERGTLRALTPGKMLRITAMPPLSAVLHAPERLRCSTCGQVKTAAVPEAVGEEKYDASACSMVALIHYDGGFPMNRLEQFQRSLGIPLPAATQWELIVRVSRVVRFIFEVLSHMAAQGQLFHNDDTTMKILSLMKEQRLAEKEGRKLDRTGMFTTGMVAVNQGHKVMLFSTGRRHAGENLEILLSRRENSQDVPLQMCDALSRNEPSTRETRVANCLTHARRKFYELFPVFPDQVKFVMGTLKGIYRNEAITKKRQMSAEERLAFHQNNSAPLMEKLQNWMSAQFNAKLVEPNSSLGKAIQYMKNNWEKLTCFLREAGAPISNDECERLLKTAIRHRQNSLFYKTEAGAMVGDMLMSVIQTAKQAGINPFDYLNALQKNESAVAQNPEAWLPWNYEETLKSQASTPNGASP